TATDLRLLLVWLLFGIEVTDKTTVNLHLAEIVVRCHVAAAIPAFVADTEVGDDVRIWMNVSSAFFRQRCSLRRGHVFEPFRRFLRSAGSHIDGQVCLTANLVDEVH